MVCTLLTRVAIKTFIRTIMTDHGHNTVSHICRYINILKYYNIIYTYRTVVNPGSLLSGMNDGLARTAATIHLAPVLFVHNLTDLFLQPYE